jgi:hypothetical protein
VGLMEIRRHILQAGGSWNQLLRPWFSRQFCKFSRC